MRITLASRKWVSLVKNSAILSLMDDNPVRRRQCNRAGTHRRPGTFGGKA
jgi:hypothetical protein